jgi:hypothetical protein
MLTAWQLSRLIDPVICRAQASQEASVSGFVDRASWHVLMQLERDEPVHDRTLWRQHKKQLQRWQWIDHAVIDFFKKYPRGIGVEVDGGLSTRFHRASELMDWPQFSWRAINTIDVADCLDFVFPLIENHVSVVCDKPLTDWTRHIRWNDPIAKIVILGEAKPLADWNTFAQLATLIQNCLNDESLTIDVLISHSIEGFLPRLETTFPGVQVISVMPKPELERGIVSRICRLLALPDRVQEVETHHLVFSRLAPGAEASV